MSQAETSQVKVLVEANGMKYEASGSVQEIVPQLIQFLIEAVPAFDLAKKLVYVSDLAGLADKVSEYAKMTPNAQFLLTQEGIPAERSVCIVLFMSHLAAKMKKREKESMSIEEISTAVGKASKTIRNVIVELQKSGLIERAERGSYRITPKGLMNLESGLKSDLVSGGPE